MLGWNHMSNLYNKHLALESFLPAFLYTNTESGWLQISGTQIGFFRHEQKIEKIKQAPTVYQILLYTSNTLSIGNPVRSFSWWGSAWIFIKIVISWPWPGVCEICKNFSNVLSIAYTNDSRVMWHLLAFNMFSCSQCHEFGKCRFFLGGTGCDTRKSTCCYPTNKNDIFISIMVWNFWRIQQKNLRGKPYVEQFLGGHEMTE